MQNGCYVVPGDVLEDLGIELIPLEEDWRCHAALEVLERVYLLRGRGWMLRNVDHIRNELRTLNNIRATPAEGSTLTK